MKPRNFVAKHMNTFNRAATHRDRTKYDRKGFNIDDLELYDEEDFGEPEYPGIADPEQFEAASISHKVYTSCLNK